MIETYFVCVKCGRAFPSNNICKDCDIEGVPLDPKDITNNDLEVLFCLALLQTLDATQIKNVLDKYLDLRKDPKKILKEIGRKNV